MGSSQEGTSGGTGKEPKKPGIGMERNRGRKILKLDETGSVIEGTGKELGKN